MNELFKPLLKNVYYIETCDEPLSSETFLFTIDGLNVIFDVGNDIKRMNALNELDNKVIVLSHFHKDHSENLKLINGYDFLYTGNKNYKSLSNSVIINGKVILKENEMEIDRMKSSHSKDSVVLLYENKYLFVGDAIYGFEENNRLLYNQQLLKEEIDYLKNSPAEYIIESHHNGLIKDKKEILNKLENIYKLRDPHNVFIEADYE